MTLPTATWRFLWIRGRAIGSSQARSRAPLSRRDLLPALRSPSCRLRSPLLSWPAPRGRFAQLSWLQRSAQRCHRRTPPPRTPTSSGTSSRSRSRRSSRVLSSTASSSRSMATTLRSPRSTPSPSQSPPPSKPAQQACRPHGLDVRRGPSSARRLRRRPRRLHLHRLPALGCPRRPPWMHGPFRQEWRRRLPTPAAPRSPRASSRATSTAWVHVLMGSLRGGKLRFLFLFLAERMLMCGAAVRF